MAERRMFAKTIIDSDSFLDMPLSSQCLYFHLNMRADDDGFINNPKRIQKFVGCCDDDLKLLIAKNFIIPFESGIVVIKHWKIHNYIRNDRYKETVYKEEKAQLIEKENKSYSLGIPNGYQMETQVRLGKDSIGKDSIDNMSCKQDDIPYPDVFSKLNTCLENEDEVFRKLNRGIYKTKEGYLENCGESNTYLSNTNIEDNVEKLDHVPYSDIIIYLNQKINSNYKETTRKTKDLIRARFNEGFTTDDFKKVIDNMTREWINDNKMKVYLRPETLFGTKFESYLNRTPKELTTKDIVENVGIEEIMKGLKL